MNVQNQWILDLTSFTTSNSEKMFKVHAPSTYGDIIRINGSKYSSIGGNTCSVVVSAPFVHISIDSNCNESITITLVDYTDQKISSSVTYNPSFIEKNTKEYETEDNLNDLWGSYSLIRTNPKLTGNIKLVVGSDSKLYIDTFKVSQTLSNIKYRHKAVSYTDYYGKNVASIFKGIDTTDLYHVEDDCYNMFTTVKNYNSQYYTKYNVGVRTNTDNLYTENFAYLAPLVIRKNLPDFFLIFKIPNDPSLNKKSELNKAKYFLSNGELIKCFDMREGSELGTYIRTIEKESRKYPADAFAAYDSKGTNRFNGISIDRGVMASASESVIAFQNAKNQVALNDYFSEGFERNRLISRNLVNLEFMFDDPTSSMFSINTYFGIYVKFNTTNNSFMCVGYDEEYLYSDDFKDIDSDYTVEIGSENEDVIYGCTDPYEFHRLRTSLKDSSINENYMLKPYKCIASSKIYINDSTKQYVSFTLNNELFIGEHLKFINTTNKEILEIIFSESDDNFDEDGISDVIINHLYFGDNLTGSDYIVYRVAIKGRARSEESDDDDKNSIIDEQTSRIKEAILKIGLKYDSDFSDGYSANVNEFKYVVRKYGYNKVSITLIGDAECIFERICDTFSSSGIDSDFDDKSMSFFGDVYVNKSILDGDNIEWKSSDYGYVFPFDFEIEKERAAYIVKCLTVTDSSLNYSIDSSMFDKKDFDYALYKNTSGDYVIYDNIKIENIVIKYSDANVVVSNVENVYKKSVEYLNGKYLINVNEPAYTNNIIDFFDIIPINCGVCSILPLRDFDFNVYDTVSSVGYSQSSSNIGGYGEYYSVDNYMGKKLLSVSEDRLYNYIDKSDSGSKYMAKDYSLGVGSTDFREYSRNLVKSNMMYSSLSLVAPHTCKWTSVSTNDTGNYIRLMYDYSNLDASSYFIPNPKEFNSHLGFQVNGKKSDTVDNYPKYISNGVDSITEEGVLMRQAIAEGDYRICDMLTDNIGININMSKVYGSGDNAVEFTSAGVRFRIISMDKNVINTDAYIDYHGVFVSTHTQNNRNNSPIELIIDEDRHEMCIVWHQCKNTLVDPNVRVLNSIEYPISLYDNISKAVKATDTSHNENSKKALSRYSSPLFSSSGINNVEIKNGYVYIKNEDGYTYDYFGENTYIIISSSSKLETTKATLSSTVIVGKVCDLTNTDFIVLSGCYMYSSNLSTFEAYPLTKTLLYDNIESHIDVTDMFVVTNDSSSYIPECFQNTQRSLSDLKDDAIGMSIIIRNNGEYKYYTNIKNIATLQVSTAMPYYRMEKGSNGKYTSVNYGYVMPCYVEPKTVDMFSFNYAADRTLIEKMGLNLDGRNIRLSNVNTIDQQWINKYTEDSDYCLNDNYTKFSFDVIHNISMFDGPWSSNRYRKYSSSSDVNEQIVYVSGYVTGTEDNAYLNSKALCLKTYSGDTFSKEINIMKWKNSKIDSINKTIRLNITDSIINYVMSYSGFPVSWNGYKYINDSYKNKFIRNYILNFISINNNNVLSVYRGNDKRTGLTLSNLASLNDTQLLTKVNNLQNELTFEDGKYYITIKLTEMYEYFAVLNIKM